MFKNIIHIVFDGFHPLLFEQVIDDLNFREDFRGFVFFENNRANYLDTFVSMPSLMSGTLFNGVDYKPWKSIALSYQLFPFFMGHGFKIQFYTDFCYELPVSIKQVEARDLQLLYQLEDDRIFQMISLIKSLIWKLPQSKFREFISVYVSKVFSIITKKKSPPQGYPEIPVSYAASLLVSFTVPLFIKMMKDMQELSSEAVYWFNHLMLPHPPCIWNRDLKFGKSNYIEQVHCAVRLMRDLILQLKKTGKFEDSLILFHSDHGWSDFGMEYPYMDSVPSAVIRKIEETTNTGAERTLHRSHTLLLVKPPGQSDERPLEISDKYTQNLDIFPTILDLSNTPHGKECEGQSVFQNEQAKPLDMFIGFHKYDRLGFKQEFGRDYKKVDLAHFVLKNGTEWTIRPDLSITTD